MSIDYTKYPMLRENRPTCPNCDGEMKRTEFPNAAWWYCTQCDAEERYTDAEMDERVSSDAESAFERNQERGSGAGFLSPDALQRSLKR